MSLLRAYAYLIQPVKCKTARVSSNTCSPWCSMECAAVFLVPLHTHTHKHTHQGSAAPHHCPLNHEPITRLAVSGALQSCVTTATSLDCQSRCQVSWFRPLNGISIKTQWKDFGFFVFLFLCLLADGRIVSRHLMLRRFSSSSPFHSLTSVSKCTNVHLAALLIHSLSF